MPMDELFDSLLQKPLPPARFIDRNAVITPPLGWALVSAYEFGLISSNPVSRISSKKSDVVDTGGLANLRPFQFLALWPAIFLRAHILVHIFWCAFLCSDLRFKIPQQRKDPLKLQF